ncbi:HAD family hydrolase [Teredinibacter purpureus]|uniref:HAD family hydrolase n=1 Tax=Teredinibacter purpureus TaxID=2731756 RepID=UPI0005F79332|nr:HAD family phosphatase [Teredinibacter purpureus]
MAITAIIFDHDGTLVDSEGIHCSIWQDLLKEDHGISFSKQEYLAHHCGVPTLTNAEVIVQQYSLNLNPEQLYEINRKRLAVWLEHNSFPLMPNARAALDKCRQAGLKMGMATGASRSEAGGSIASHQLAEYFSVVTTRDDVTNTKPAADTYKQTAQQLGVKPEHCIAIEDSSTGVQSAVAAGIACIAVENEFSDSQDLSKARWQVANLMEAVDLALSL